MKEILFDGWNPFHCVITVNLQFFPHEFSVFFCLKVIGHWEQYTRSAFDISSLFAWTETNQGVWLYQLIQIYLWPVDVHSFFIAQDLHQQDVYSFGHVLYEMTFGKELRAGTTDEIPANCPPLIGKLKLLSFWFAISYIHAWHLLLIYEFWSSTRRIFKSSFVW